MNKGITGKIVTYFHNIWHAKPSSKGWYDFKCPYCECYNLSNRIAFNPVNGIIKCWSPSCTFGKNSITEFIKEQHNLSNYLEVVKYLEPFEDSEFVIEHGVRRLTPKVDIELPFGYKSLTEGNGLLARRARAYLEKRGFDIKKLDYKGFGYCDEQCEKIVEGKKQIDYEKDFYGYIIVPFYSNHKLIYYLGRDFLNRQPKYKYKNIAYEVFGIERSEIFYNQDAINKHDTVFLNEGWADAETIGSQGIASLGWSLSAKQKSMLLRSKIKNLVIVSDKGAYKKAVELAIDFISTKKVFVVSFENANGKDVNEVGLQEFYLMYEGTPQMTNELAISILTNYK